MTNLSNTGGGGLFIFLGPGRFASSVHPATIAASDLRSVCDVALIFDKCSTEASQARFAHEDNRKSRMELAAEDPHRMARLLMARGVKVVVMAATATPPQIALQLASAVTEGLTVRQLEVAEAVQAALTTVAAEFELTHVKDSGLVVWGAGFASGAALAGAAATGKVGKAGKK